MLMLIMREKCRRRRGVVVVVDWEDEFVEMLKVE